MRVIAVPNLSMGCLGDLPSKVQVVAKGNLQDHRDTPGASLVRKLYNNVRILPCEHTAAACTAWPRAYEYDRSLAKCEFESVELR